MFIDLKLSAWFSKKSKDYAVMRSNMLHKVMKGALFYKQKGGGAEDREESCSVHSRGGSSR